MGTVRYLLAAAVALGYFPGRKPYVAAWRGTARSLQSFLDMLVYRTSHSRHLARHVRILPLYDTKRLDHRYSLAVPACNCRIAAISFPDDAVELHRSDLGRASYIVYLNHLLIGYLITQAGIPAQWQLYAALTTSTVVGILVHLAVEAPLDDARRRKFSAPEANLSRSPGDGITRSTTSIRKSSVRI